MSSYATQRGNICEASKLDFGTICPTFRARFRGHDFDYLRNVIYYGKQTDTVLSEKVSSENIRLICVVYLLYCSGNYIYDILDHAEYAGVKC